MPEGVQRLSLCVHVVRAHRLLRYHSCPLRQDRGERQNEEGSIGIDI